MAQIVVNAMPITNYGASNIVVNAVPIQAKTMSIAEVKGKDLSETKEELTTDGSSGHDYRIGLSWDFADKDGDGKGDTDLDLSAICLDAEGRFKGACYFAEMRPFARAILHHGDNRDGKGEGDDEVIEIDLDGLKQQGIAVVYFVVNSFNGDSFRNVKTATCRVVANLGKPVEIHNCSMACESRTATSIIAARAYSQDNRWYFNNICATGNENCFAGLIPECQGLSEDIIPGIEVRKPPKSLILTKGESLQISGTQCTVGCGWDMVSKAIDLDASVKCYDANYRCLDTCFFGRKVLFNGAVRHSGDNRTGEGDGDDESIVIDFTRLPMNVSYCMVLANSYDGDKFTGIKNAYVRLLNQGNVETHRYALANFGAFVGYIICTFYKAANGSWKMKANSQPCRGNTSKKKESEQDCLSALNHFYDHMHR